MTTIRPQKQDMQDMKQDIKQGQKVRAYWEAGRTGHEIPPAYAREMKYFAKNTPHCNTYRARIGRISCPVRPASHINIGFHVLLLPLLHVLHVLLLNFEVKKCL